MTTSPLRSGLGEQRVPHRPTWWAAKDTREVTVIWGVLTVVFIVFALTVPTQMMGPPASDTMREVGLTFTVFSVVSSPVAAFVCAMAIFSLWRYRRRGDWKPGDGDGPPIRGNGWGTGLWMGVSSVLCLFLLIWGFAEIQATAAPAQAQNPLVVRVTGQQWLWNFTYPGKSHVQSDVLYLPVDRPVVFKVTSMDVIHSFWVVQMGIKVDANPGMVTQTQTIPTTIGTYDVRCAELCGLLHADMETTAKVVSPTAFTHWLEGQHRSAQ